MYIYMCIYICVYKYIYIHRALLLATHLDFPGYFLRTWPVRLK